MLEQHINRQTMNEVKIATTAGGATIQTNNPGLPSETVQNLILL